VLACSALKESYREFLVSKSGQGIKWVVLHAPAEVLTERLNKRQDHFFDGSLLRSQLDDFEMPEYGILADVQPSPQEVVDDILRRLQEV